MSDSIWHKYDIKDIPNPRKQILTWNGFGHGVTLIYLEDWEQGFCDWIEHWAYVEDIIAQADKAERLQKAVDLALERFDDIKRLYDKYYDKYSVIATETTEEIKHIIKEN